MRTGIVISLTLGLLWTASVWADSPGQKTGWVDTERVFKDYYRAREMLGDDSALVKEKESKEEQLKKLESQIRVLQKDLEQKALLLNQTALRKQQEEIQTKFESYRLLKKEAEIELQGRIMEVTRDLSQEIEQKISQFAQDHGYSYVFRGELLFYKNPADDLTEKVLAELNRGHEMELEPAPTEQ